MQAIHMGTAVLWHKERHLTVHDFCSNFAITATVATERAASRAAATPSRKSTPCHFYPSLISSWIFSLLSKGFKIWASAAIANTCWQGKLNNLGPRLLGDCWLSGVSSLACGSRIARKFLDMSCYVHGHLCVCVCVRLSTLHALSTVEATYAM